MRTAFYRSKLAARTGQSHWRTACSKPPAVRRPAPSGRGAGPRLPAIRLPATRLDRPSFNAYHSATWTKISRCWVNA